MAIITKPVFSTDMTDFSWTWSDANPKTGVDLKQPYPPTSDNNMSLLITLTTTAGADTISLKCYQGFYLNGSIVYGPAQTITDENGNAITFSSSSATQIVANLYAQLWWTLCDAVKIEMTGNSGQALGGQAAVIMR